MFLRDGILSHIEVNLLFLESPFMVSTPPNMVNLLPKLIEAA